MKSNSKHITIKFAASLLVNRDPNAHKYTYGHALLVCGSYNMPGAALLATGGALRSGCGLVTTHACKGVRTALIANYPSAILDSEASDVFSTLPAGLERYDVVGFGCGLGQNEQTIRAVEQLLTSCKTLDIPLVIDADGLNIIAKKGWKIPQNSIITPHPLEASRLLGCSLEKILNEPEYSAKKLTEKYNCVTVLKMHRTMVCSKSYDIYVNEVPLKEGVLDFLNYLKCQGIKTGIATSNSRELLIAVLESLQAVAYFDEIHTSCEVAKGKPEPDIYLLVANYLGVDPEHCLVFEDIIPGIQAGKAAGMKVCAVKDDFSINEEEEKKKAADWFIDSFSELMGCIR